MIGTITNPHFVDLEKTLVRFTLINENGISSTAELKVPPNKEKGINEYWDYILDNFDIEEMRRKRNEQETLRRKQLEIEDKKKKAVEENTRLKILFNKKMKSFEIPFIKEAPDDIKSAIRRSPDIDTLNFILNSYTQEFMKTNNMSFIDYLDYLDDVEDEAAAAKESK